jgi:CRP-like cAMP-binding protein
MNKAELILAQTEPLLDYFQKLIPLNDGEKQLVTDLFKPRLYRKRQYLLQEGDRCSQFSFVVRGGLRMFKIDERGNTHILQFAKENNWLERNEKGGYSGFWQLRVQFQ